MDINVIRHPFYVDNSGGNLRGSHFWADGQRETALGVDYISDCLVSGIDSGCDGFFWSRATHARQLPMTQPSQRLLVAISISLPRGCDWAL
jgi:hypothetical protein